LEQRAINQTFDQDDAFLYENLLELDDQLREQYKQNLRKKYAGQVLYSDVIGNDRKELHLWSLVLNRLQQRGVDTRKIRRLMHSTGQNRALQMDLPAATRAQQECKQLYKLHKKSRRIAPSFQITRQRMTCNQIQDLGRESTQITQNAFKSKNTFSRIRKVVQQGTQRLFSMPPYPRPMETQMEAHPLFARRRQFRSDICLA
jgi:hypothetical protein